MQNRTFVLFMSNIASLLTATILTDFDDNASVESGNATLAPGEPCVMLLGQHRNERVTGM